MTAVLPFDNRIPARSGGGTRITLQQYLSETSDEERMILAQELAAAAQFFTENDRTVYLEGLGLLIPTKNCETPLHSIECGYLIRNELKRVIAFEKCRELTSFQRDRWTPLVELKELTRRIHPRLPVSLNAKWSPAELRRYLRGLLKHVAYEVVVKGASSQLADVGTLYSLHNRQGSTLRDWYAGADIFIKPAETPPIEVGPARRFIPPVLRDAWEPFCAAYGPARETMRMPLAAELRELGYALPADQQTAVDIAVFRRKGSGRPVLMYCTDGLRRIAHERGGAAGVELVLQLPEDSEANAAPRWPLRALAMGWILVQGSRSGALRPGVGLACGVPLRDGSRLSMVFSTPLTVLRQPARCSSGSFSYMNLVGITEAEAGMARRHTADYLMALLEYKKLDQLTKINRRCLITRDAATDCGQRSLAQAS